MKIFQPKILTTIKDYSIKKFTSDFVAGIIVAIIALPLSIALAIASGVAPEKGLYTAIIAGFVISLFGGSRVNISGPTAAFATIVAGIVMQYGINGLIIATIMAGIILIIMGICRFGNLIRFIPHTITTGFTAGIAITIIIGQLKDFLGLTYPDGTHAVETVEKIRATVSSISTINLWSVVVGVIGLAILIVWPKISKKIPGSLIAVIVGTVIVKLFNMPVNTIGDLYTISGSLPAFSVPTVDMSTIRQLLPSAFTIAILAAIESLLSCVVSDGMIKDKHNSNTELIAQGLGNICSGFFGGIPATGAIARTAANVKNGGKTPVAGIIHALLLLLILVLLMPYAAWIPMPIIAAILFMVAYNMSEWRQFVSICKKAPKSDIAVLALTFALTVIFDLVVAIEVGLALTFILFLKKMSDVTSVRRWGSANDKRQKTIDGKTAVYEFDGPLFFATSDIFSEIVPEKDIETVILRMHNVPSIDISAMRSMSQYFDSLKARGIRVIFAHINKQPMRAMKKAGFISKIGSENLAANIDEAIAMATSGRENNN